jgi:hypothetical protein
MKWKTIRWRVRYYLQFLPFTLNTILCAAAVWVLYYVLYRQQPKDLRENTDSFLAITLLMGRIAFWFVLALVALSVLSTFAAWLYYIWLRENKSIFLDIKFELEEKKNGRRRLWLNAGLEQVWRPLLGFVKGRLFYDDHRLTDTFSLQGNKRKEHSLSRAAIIGKNRVALPDIKEYQVNGGIIFFQDMLHLFSLPVKQPVRASFYQPPLTTDEEERQVYPKKTETLDVRIEQLRRVEGDYLNYKDFETGDDVRRIVWKVYAKNKELVVRVPELFEPFASHLYFYASFDAGKSSQWAGEGYLAEMLNYYKNYVWTIYDALAQKEWAMRYIPDQQFSIPDHVPERERDMRVISNSDWQHDNPVDRYFNTKNGAVLCISSLTDPAALKQVLDQADEATVIYFIKLSGVFRSPVALNWLKRLIFLPPHDRLSKLRSRWLFTPLRLQVQRREKEIETMLKQHNNAAVL